jgi:hypothetical protein
MKRTTMDDLHGDTVVARITISMARSGMMKVEGSITDHEFAMHMLDTARDVVNNYHGRALQSDAPLIVPANDTSLVGTESEKKLLAARHELASAM